MTKPSKRTSLFYLTAAALCTALIAVCSYVSIPVGNLKFTLQLLAVLFTAGVLPSLYAILSVAVYVTLGLVGVPVYAGFTAGVGAIAGPTGGFILGFLPACAAAAFALRLLRRKETRFLYLIYAAVFVGATLIVYVCGAVGFLIYMPEKGLSYVLTAAILPYTGFDLLKILLAAFLSLRLQPVLQKYACKK